jgi:hypothetical protein
MADLDLSSHGASGRQKRSPTFKVEGGGVEAPTAIAASAETRIFKLRNLAPLHRLPPRAKPPITAFAAIRIAQRWR